MWNRLSLLRNGRPLRYHDFHRYGRTAVTAFSSTFVPAGILSAQSSTFSASPFLTTSVFPNGVSSRTFLTWATGAFGNSSGRMAASSNVLGKLKQLEKQANAAPQDPEAQYRFIRALVDAKHDTAVMIRMGNPTFAQFAVSAQTALLYLQTIQRKREIHGLNVDDLLNRLIKTYQTVHPGYVECIREYQEQMVLQKLSKQELVDDLIQFFSTGTSPALGVTLGQLSTYAPAAAAGTASPAAAVNPSGWMGAAGPAVGMSARDPLHVQVVPTPTSIWGTLGLYAFRAAIFFVGISAIGALLDDKGLRGGMAGLGSNKHVQEAEQQKRKVKFDDVKGVDEAKAELEEIVEYLRNPDKFTRLGGKLPRGLLLTGPPGTGKTLLAKAIAGEADVPFYYSSGSQFEEVYVGLGAKRIRELFEAAKKKAPAIIFIDEIDAVGGTRRLKDQSALKQTLNELLVQMDGFDENSGIIVIGATNFIESLDPALMRPGRFDKHVNVPLPDVGGRREILELYAKKTKLAPDVDLSVLARGTIGFSGADLFNLINQAALKASVDELNAVTMSVLEYAKDKIIMGAERKSAIISPEDHRCTAFHEAGHAVVAALTKGTKPIHKATIVPRGNALGMVALLPEGDQNSQSFKEMLAQMDVLMGGRVAEELIFGKENVTSGALSDIQQASRLARAMVTKFGYSDEVVGIVYHDDQSASTTTRDLIDAEVKKLTNAAYERAKELLIQNADVHKLLAETLLEYETLTGDEVRDVVLRRTKPQRPALTKRKDKNNSSSNDNDKTNNDRKKKKQQDDGVDKEPSSKRGQKSSWFLRGKDEDAA